MSTKAKGKKKQRTRVEGRFIRLGSWGHKSNSLVSSPPIIQNLCNEKLIDTRNQPPMQAPASFIISWHILYSYVF
jgi:hypothetical protein